MEDEKTIRIGFPFGVWFSPFIQKKIRQLKMWNLLWIDLVGWLKSGGDFFLQPLNRPWFLSGKNPGGVTVTNRLPEALGCPCCCGSTRRGDEISTTWELVLSPKMVGIHLLMVGGGAKFFFCFSTRWREMKILNKKPENQDFQKKSLWKEYTVYWIFLHLTDVWPRLGRPRAA